MKHLKYALVVLSVVLNLLLGVIVIENIHPVHSWLPEDAYAFYIRRATELEDEAKALRQLGFNAEAQGTLRACSLAKQEAEQCRTLYNHQLAVRLSRALYDVHDVKMFRDAYNAQKL